MASTALADVNSGVTVGRVFGRAMDVIRANPLATLGISFVCISLPSLLLGLFSNRINIFVSMREGAYGVAAGYGLVISFLWLTASGALVQATMAHDQGHRADPQEMVQTGIMRALPLLGVYIFFVIGVWIGSIALFVPGIMLAVRWAVALPAIVAERTGVFGAFGRSAELTKGARWQVFGILLLAFVIYMLLSAFLLLLAIAGSGSFAALARPEIAQPSIIALLVQSVVSTMIITWITVVGASLFVELRHWKEGPDADRLADIFS